MSPSTQMRAAYKILILISATVALHSTAQVITYNTFGEPGDTYTNGSGWLVNGSANPPQPYVGEAFAFTPSVSGTLSRVSLVLSAGNTNLASDLANVVISDNSPGNLPNARLETFSNVACSGPFGANNPLTSLTAATRPFLQAGNTYWLSVEPATSTADVIVNQNSLGLLASQAQEFSRFNWIARGNKTTFAFSVEVVPEPSILALAALGIFGFVRRR
ncbi:MAG: hypothetical protein C5B50_13455 [Verrucomicrobia bacterium]|nr:MAG: hypothetical protein C5B50_13455 [Verrucomicrobiota bacterium]